MRRVSAGFSSMMWAVAPLATSRPVAIRWNSSSEDGSTTFSPTGGDYTGGNKDMADQPAIGGMKGGLEPPTYATGTKLYPVPNMDPRDEMAVKNGRRELFSSTEHEDPSSADAVPLSDRMSAGRMKRVGNVFLVSVADLPHKYHWEINAYLRMLFVEFRHQFTVVPDEPKYRAILFRVRHIVTIQQISVDQLKKLLDVPSHIEFRDLRQTLPEGMNHERFPGVHQEFQHSSLPALKRARKERLRDIIKRDQAELRLLRERKELKRQHAAQL